jgi:hypothetical protein
MPPHKKMSKKQEALITKILTGLRESPDTQEFRTVELDNNRALPAGCVLSKIRYILGDCAIELSIDFDRQDLDTAIFG